jgi:hypothetical protein
VNPPSSPLSPISFQRSRWWYFAFALITVVLGLSTRKFGSSLPAFLATYGGDTLWSLLVFWLWGWLFPRASTGRIVVFAGVFSLLIELSQLIQTPWLQELRQIKLIALVIGHGFLWSDLLCYAVGIGIGAGFEWGWRKWKGFSS